jgi:sulfatase modifying factor 1
MSGNVYEKCWDWYATYPVSDKTDYRGPANGSFRVDRGGCWSEDASKCQVSYRGNTGAFGSGNYIGFRLARSK